MKQSDDVEKVISNLTRLANGEDPEVIYEVMSGEGEGYGWACTPGNGTIWLGRTDFSITEEEMHARFLKDLEAGKFPELSKHEIK